MLSSLVLANTAALAFSNSSVIRVFDLPFLAILTFLHLSTSSPSLLEIDCLVQSSCPFFFLSFLCFLTEDTLKSESFLLLVSLELDVE